MHLTEREWNEKRAAIIIALLERAFLKYKAEVNYVDSVADQFMQSLGYTKEEPKP